MSSAIQNMFAQAKKEAMRSHFRIRMGAVVVRQNRVMGRGCNVMKSHPIMNKPGNYFRSLHAEIAACLDAGRDLEYTTIWVARILKNGDFALAKPCELCDELLARFKVKRVFYTVDNTTFGEVTYGQGLRRYV